MTPKGQLLKIETLNSEFKTSVNKWRKQSNRVMVLITDKSSDLEVLRFERKIFEAPYVILELHLTKPVIYPKVTTHTPFLE